MFLSLLTHIIIHWTSLSLLLILISLQPYHNLFFTVSDHLPIFTHLTPTSSLPRSKIIFSRTRKNINIVKFNNDLASSDLILHHLTSLPELLDSYDSTLCSIPDKHAPLITKPSKPHKPNPWYIPALLALKSACHHLKCKYTSTHSNKPISRTDRSF